MCDINPREGKMPLCVFVRGGKREHYACIRTAERRSGCHVDSRGGTTKVVCLCDDEDFCNVAMAERIDDRTVVAERVNVPVVQRVTPEISFEVESDYDAVSRVDNIEEPLSPTAMRPLPGLDPKELVILPVHPLNTIPSLDPPSRPAPPTYSYITPSSTTTLTTAYHTSTSTRPYEHLPSSIAPWRPAVTTPPPRHPSTPLPPRHPSTPLLPRHPSTPLPPRDPFGRRPVPPPSISRINSYLESAPEYPAVFPRRYGETQSTTPPNTYFITAGHRTTSTERPTTRTRPTTTTTTTTTTTATPTSTTLSTTTPTTASSTGTTSVSTTTVWLLRVSSKGPVREDRPSLLVTKKPLKELDSSLKSPPLHDSSLPLSIASLLILLSFYYF